MGRPLYKGSEEASNVGNAGLWYDKFFDLWDSSGKKLNDDGKQAWVRQMAGVEVGDNLQLEQARSRLDRLLISRKGHSLAMKTAGPFVTGLGRNHPVENGFAWHQTLGVPYLPGSSVKGMVRAWAETWEGFAGEEVSRIFGPRGDSAEEPASQGSVLFLDALPPKPVRLKGEIMTPHYGPWYQNPKEVPGDWHSPNIIPFLAVDQGQNFTFAVLPARSRCEKSIADTVLVTKLMKEVLEWMGAGAKTATGYGRFELDQNENARIQRERQAQEKADLEAKRKAELESIPEEERKLFQLQEGDLSEDGVTELFRDLDSMEECLRQKAAQALKAYWQDKGSWNVKPKKKKQYQKVQRIKEILGE